MGKPNCCTCPFLPSSALRFPPMAAPSPKAKTPFYNLWNGPHLLNPKAKRLAFLFPLALTRDHLWNCFRIPFPIMKAKCGSHLNCFPNITKPCTCNLTKLKPMLCLNSSSCARSINLLASVSSASLPHACMSNCF